MKKHDIDLETREFLKKEKPPEHIAKCSHCDDYLFLSRDYDYYLSLEYVIENIGKKKS
jgi:hypothetical protein